jgi:hypothetical protein
MTASPAVRLSLFHFHFSHVTAVTLILALAACAQSPNSATPKPITRGDPCPTLAEIATDAEGTALVCLSTNAGKVWGIPDKKQWVKGTRTPDASCGKFGELSRAPDGSVMICAYTNINQPAKESAGGQ